MEYNKSLSVLARSLVEYSADISRKEKPLFCYGGELYFYQKSICLCVQDAHIWSALTSRYSQYEAEEECFLRLEVIGSIARPTINETIIQVFSSRAASSFLVSEQNKVHFVRRGGTGTLLRAGSWSGYVCHSENSIARQRELLYAALDREITYHLSRLAEDCLFFHAVVLQRKTETIVLIGPSGAGKSSICSELHEHGWIVFADDIVPWRSSDNVFLPFPRRPAGQTQKYVGVGVVNSKELLLNSVNFFVLCEKKDITSINDCGSMQAFEAAVAAALFPEDVAHAELLMDFIAIGRWRSIRLKMGAIAEAASIINKCVETNVNERRN